MPSRSHSMTRFNILPLFSRSASSPIKVPLPIVHHRSSCRLRAQSPRRTHTHGNATPRVSLRALSVDVSPPNFVRRRACHTSCIAAARTCVHRLADSPRAVVQRILSFVLERRSTLSTRQTMPRPFLHVCPLRSQTAQPSAPPAVALMHTALASRESCIPSQSTSRAHKASLAVPCPSPPILS